MSVRTITKVATGGSVIPAFTETISLRIIAAETVAAQPDAAQFAFTFPDTNAAQIEAAKLGIATYADTNAAETDALTKLSMGATDTNAAETDAVANLSIATYNDSNAAQTEAVKTTFPSGDYGDSNPAPTETRSFQLYFSSSGTGNFTAPVTGNYLVEGVGGSGGSPGGSTLSSYAAANGADYASVVIALTAGQVCAYQVGAGGSAGAANGSGGAGTPTFFKNPAGTIVMQAAAGKPGLNGVLTQTANTGSVGSTIFAGGLGGAGAALAGGAGGGGAANDSGAGNNGAAGSGSASTGGTAGPGTMGSGNGSGANSSGVPAAANIYGGGGASAGFNALSPGAGVAGVIGRMRITFTP